MKRMIRTLVFVATAGSVAPAAAAEKLIAESGSHRVSLIELYSSESCSSCPPADRWMSTLKTDAGLWKDFVPVVFHVDYWNHLSWVDRLSSKDMTQRQIDVSRHWLSPRVYTPAVVADGEEWTSWSRGARPKSAETKVKISISKRSDQDFTVHVDGVAKGNYVVRMALLGSGLKTKVTAGENAGRELKHDFVVLSWDRRSLEGPGDAHFTFSKPRHVTSVSVAAWIEEKNNPVPLQAAGGDL